MLRFIIRRTLTTSTKDNSLQVGLAVANANNILTEKKELDVDDDNEYEDMFVKTAFQNMEWGGPLRGGRLPEPTRFGDWERKGRCTDY